MIGDLSPAIWHAGALHLHEIVAGADERARIDRVKLTFARAAALSVSCVARTTSLTLRMPNGSFNW